ncbi:hypothetical protein [Sulfitobacter sp. JB4-11]|uniref:hypothetical protein n=1 Tax=Sulfitobacter rhodophyticola TaxID=3238304 RepID=UPI00351588C9
MTGGCPFSVNENTMILSGNELMTLAAKAARGAGAPPQQAAEFGRAALCHMRAGRDTDQLLTALDALPAGVILDLPLRLTRILEGAQGTKAQGTLPLTGTPDLIHSYIDALPYAVATTARGETIDITLSLDTPAPPIPPARITLPKPLATRMSALAAQLLVPDSAASREGGAGAGLTDND